jgi:hypothetical protein
MWMWIHLGFMKAVMARSHYVCRITSLLLTARALYLQSASVSFVSHHTARYELSEPPVLLTKLYVLDI